LSAHRATGELKRASEGVHNDLQTMILEQSEQQAQDNEACQNLFKQGSLCSLSIMMYEIE
jgi:hypothetical protein